MKAVKVPVKKAESVKALLKEKSLLVPGVSAFHKNGFVYFPVASVPKGFTATQAVFPKKREQGGLKESLKKVLSEKQLSELVKSFDVVGGVCIIEVPKTLEKKKKLIANALLKGNVTTVLRKKSAMKGKYRVRELAWLAGEKTMTALYKESGAVMRVSLDKSYFSVRLAHERTRIAKQVKKGEKILCLFAGVGPYPLVFFKKEKNISVVAIELNPHAVKELKENVALNKAQKVITVVRGDVKKIVPSRYARWADRIVMPLPHTAFEYLDPVLAGAASGCVIHFYGFTEKNNLQKLVKIVKEACARNNRKCRVLRKRVARPYSPVLVQGVVDFKVV